MKVLVINGSPKVENSNTMYLTRAFLEGADWKDVETVNIASIDIKPCLGCFACWNKTPGKCIIQDDVSGILEKLIAADVIIWSFPLYYFSIPGPLKNLIDRQLPLNLPFMDSGNESGGHAARYDVSHQRHILISTCGFWTSEGNYNAVTELFDHILGKEKYDKIFCSQGELFAIQELRVQTGEYLKAVRRAGNEYREGGISSDTQAELAIPMFPRKQFEEMADASWGIDEKGNHSEESLNFTKQMAALYIPDGVERVLEMHYTDIDRVYQLVMSSKGIEVITDHFQTYTTKIETSYALWKEIARGEISGQEALFQHKYKVKGDFDLMLKWDELFGGSKEEKKSSLVKENKTNMMVFLLPWMVIWTAIAINPVVGSTLGIVVAAIVPLLWIRFQPVVYEQISIPLVIILSLAVLLGGNVQIIVALSYLIFGFIWLAGTFTKIPLTAHYSANGYGGKNAHNNPLFTKTNRILTAAWGVLYIITSIWTYFLMNTNLASYTGLINVISPITMGIFTVWFQKWYPAWQARR